MPGSRQSSQDSKARPDPPSPPGAFVNLPSYRSKPNGWWQRAPRLPVHPPITVGVQNVYNGNFPSCLGAVQPSGASVGCSSTSKAT